MRLYADQSAYEAYHGLAAGAAPATVDRLLRTASRVVDRLLHAVVYATDADGYPTDPDVAQALSDATAAIAGGDNPTKGATALVGAEQRWKSVSIGNVSLSGRQAPDGAVVVDGVLVPVAARIALESVGPVVVVTR